ncbi:MAG: amidohydrolase [Oscillospiraceae bacterium]
MKRADIILLSENIFTAGPLGMISGGIAIADNKILLVGSKEAVLALADEGTELRDCGTRLITPGICDSHIHLFAGAYMTAGPNVGGNSSALDCAKALYEYYKQNEGDYADGEWLCACGFVIAEWDDPTAPTKEILDQFFPDRPVYIYDSDLHAAWVNSKAIELVGIPADAKDTRFGRYARDAQGNITGYLVEETQNDFVKYAFNVPAAKERRLISAKSNDMCKYGITSVTDMRALNNYNMGSLDVLNGMVEDGSLKFRYNYANCMPGTLEDALENKAKYGDPDKKIFFAGIKEFIDGIVVAHTGLLLDPYTDDPDANYNFWATDLEYNAARVKEYHKHGINLHFHAVGDGAVRKAIEMYEAALLENGETGSRMSIEHLDMSAPQDWARMAKAGIICSVQPQHLALYPKFEDEQYADCVGADRTKSLWAFKSMLDNGIPLAFGTDFPVVTYDSRISLHRAVTRKYPDGQPVNGWNPEQKLSLWDALYAYTWGGAYKVGKEAVVGSLENGKLADLVVWDCNLFDIPADDILNSNVILTVFDGSVVYEA